MQGTFVLNSLILIHLPRLLLIMRRIGSQGMQRIWRRIDSRGLQRIWRRIDSQGMQRIWRRIACLLATAVARPVRMRLVDSSTVVIFGTLVVMRFLEASVAVTRALEVLPVMPLFEAHITVMHAELLAMAEVGTHRG